MSKDPPLWVSIDATPDEAQKESLLVAQVANEESAHYLDFKQARISRKRFHRWVVKPVTNNSQGNFKGLRHNYLMRKINLVNLVLYLEGNDELDWSTFHLEDLLVLKDKVLWKFYRSLEPYYRPSHLLFVPLLQRLTIWDKIHVIWNF
jgi:hypothetical protein